MTKEDKGRTEWAKTLHEIPLPILIPMYDELKKVIEKRHQEYIADAAAFRRAEIQRLENYFKKRGIKQ